MSWPRWGALWGIIALLLLSSTVATSAADATPHTAPVVPWGFGTDVVPLPAGEVAGPLPALAPVHLTVALLPSQAAGLGTLDSALLNPASPEYRHFLTESEFQSRFSPPASDVRAVQAYFAGFGATQFTTTPDRLGVSFEIPARGVDAALGVQLETYGPTGGRLSYTSLGNPTLPAYLQGEVAGIDGLSDGGRLSSSLHLGGPPEVRTRALAGPGQFVEGGPGGQQWFIGSDYTQAYGVSSLFPGGTLGPNATFPRHEAVATILMSSYNASVGDLPPWDPTVVNQYFNDTFPSTWPHPNITGIPVTVDGVTPPAPGSLGVYNDSFNDEIENSLDLEMAGSLAPGATIANFYFAASVYLGTTQGQFGPVADDFATALGAALNYSYSNASLVAVSNSYGLPDLTDSLWNEELANAATTGVTVVAASGDQGNAPNSVSGRFQGSTPTWPGTAVGNTTGTIAVGGVTLTAGGVATGVYVQGGNLTDGYDAAFQGISSQVAWYDLSGPNASGSEGGGSIVVPEPYWQFHSAAQPAIANMSDAQGLSSLGRAEPDISGPANTTIAYVLASGGQVYFAVLEGTSIASPVFAGMLASMAAVSGHLYGFIDPELYRVGSYYGATPGASDPFIDVITGRNWEFFAGVGWDPVTGWGTLNAPAFLVADATPAISDYGYLGPTPGISTKSAPGPPIDLTPILVVVGVVLTGVVIAVIVLGTRRPRGPRGPSAPPPGAVYGYPPGAGGAPNYAYNPTPPPWGPTSPPQPMTSAHAPPAWGYPGPPPLDLPPVATFACPYCNNPRPAEPGRCPHCGAF